MISEEEMTLLNNTEWILTKRLLIEKVSDLFGILYTSFKKYPKPFNQVFPAGSDIMPGKISRGENYRSLPYVILDYPAFFCKEDILVIRTMFWWGHFFSITLQLSGSIKRKFIGDQYLISSWIKSKEYFICINKDPWEHHFESDNYVLASAITNEQIAEIWKNPFFKISKKLPISDWIYAEEYLKKGFEELLEFLQLNFQGDGKDLLSVSPKVDSGL